MESRADVQTLMAPMPMPEGFFRERPHQTGTYLVCEIFPKIFILFVVDGRMDGGEHGSIGGGEHGCGYCDLCISSKAAWV